MLYPDLEKPFRSLADSLYLAYSAFNGPDWVEFIVQRRTPWRKGLPSATTPSPSRQPSTNTIMATP